MNNVSKPTIAVLGSINMDLVIRCDHLPKPGETVSAQSMTEVPGGKGANQAVAAARCGGAVRMIGCVGDDGFGQKLLANLIAESIDCDAVLKAESCESGLAIVNVENSGENAIIVIPGANARITPADVRRFENAINDCDVLMVQLETPQPTVLAGIQTAKRSGAKVILDPAPAATLGDGLLDVDLICPNESEATAIVGGRIETIDDAVAIAKQLHARGPAAVAITLGPRGTMLYDGARAELIESIEVDAVDTTAAGDAFAGALAVRWAETGSLRDAIAWANRAGALAASKRGAQPSLPQRTQIDAVCD
ncbi:Ribokinase [Stieleria maiorica]|uniref:Ribokinase n=1 Tax=Stieleria maiorica TaxID=2795974 RepID=A0A5B9MH54_9BACT|nr:ribokinase [Stieleria maiorica]QEF99456.1 Ribokinase [Stieleria maiorica]